MRMKNDWKWGRGFFLDDGNVLLIRYCGDVFHNSLNILKFIGLYIMVSFMVYILYYSKIVKRKSESSRYQVEN